MSYVKLALGALVGGLVVLHTALGDGSVSYAEWAEVAIAALAGTGLVSLDPRKSE